MRKTCTTTYLMVGFLVALTMVGRVSSQEQQPQELSCGHHCQCSQKRNKWNELEFKVICNNTENQHAILSDAVLTQVFHGGSRDSSVDTLYVLVKNTSSLNVTISFITKWRQFPASIFDIWKGGRVTLPQMNNLTLNRDSTHVFAGIGIHTCTLETFPGGLFEGKLKTGLRLDASTINHFSSEVFHGTSITYLNINHTRIGTYEGKHGNTQLYNDRSTSNIKKSYIYIGNSKLGLINKGALAFSSEFERWMTIENVTVGYMQTGSVQMTGKMGLKIENSRVADLSYESLEISSTATSIIRNNILIAHPHALTNIECSEFTNKIYNNQIISIPSDNVMTKELHSIGANKSIDKISLGDKHTHYPIISSTSYKPPTQFIHRSCIKPISLKLNDSGEGNLHHALHISIGLIILAVVVIIILAVLLIRAKEIKKTTIVHVGDLSDPIYDEPDNVMIMNERAPPLPTSPLPVNLAIPDFCKGTPQSNVRVNNGCGSHRFLERTTSQDSKENEYFKMK